MDQRGFSFIIGLIVLCMTGDISLADFSELSPPNFDETSSSSNSTVPPLNEASSLSEETDSSNATNSDGDTLGSLFVLGESNGTSLSYDRLKNLQATLLEGYETTIRPRINQSNTVIVNTSFSLTSVVDIDTTAQRVDIMGYFFVTWKDDVIRWNPNEYSGTSSIKLPLSKIWYPALVLGKTYDGSKTIGNVDKDRVVVSSNGVVQWVPDGIFSFMFEVSVKYYPFDIQTCELLYYVSDETKLSVHLMGQKSVQLQDYVENSEWRLADASSRTKEVYNTNFVYLTFKVERRADFTVYTMIVPLVTLSVLNIFTFLVPIESGEKSGLAITLFLAYGFFITITRDALPHNSVEISYYVVYITVLLVLSVFTVVYVIVESKVYSSLGKSPFHVCGWFWSKYSDVKKVTPATQNESFPEKECMNENIKTWEDILGPIDTTVFVFSTIFVILLNIILWPIVITGN